ncbi:S8 family peptidase [Natronolimnohabitans innermongolicus]|uniref:Peptidase S8/S53 subtilisin kexin sedolisin n=1 Tax=Natronolimnohabitans innermongolicus JCM 12255 TaxID=1227499 RepID=L9X4M4_9EURY|nr:S8 family peptidase [Natronolimnohabitans innermongolicus]ELY55518.1 peptidase S8/S53 subtilisin kexin sedolisin [Natronolimnohabitans innermongolicus JCM 12255]
MQLSRRRVLQSVGVGVAAGVIGSPASATESDDDAEAETGADTERVFVHPQTSLLDGLGELLSVIESLGGTTLLEYDNFEFVVAEIPTENRSVLRSDRRVSFIEDDDETGIPDDWSPSVLDFLLPPDRSDCSTHPEQRASWGLERIGADEVEPDGSGVDIGILDTGIQTDHCSLSVEGGQNFTADGTAGDYEDRHGHGTHVAGVAGATDNDRGVVGVAPASDLYAVKVLDDDGSGRYSELIAGIDWCVSNDIELISMSLGGESSSSAVDQAIETAHDAGHLLVTAAGNEGNAGDGTCGAETMTYPATHDDVIAVTAMNEDETLASYSSVGSAVDLLAPGTDVTSTTVGNEYAEASGTSIAAPFVAGVAALCWQTREEDGPGPNESIRDILGETAETVLDTCEEGDGLVDARAAVGDERATEGGEHGSDARSLLDRVTSVVRRVADLLTGALEWLRGLFG